MDGLLERIRQAKTVAVDVETDGLQAWHGNQLCGVGLAFDEDDGVYVPFRHPEGNAAIEHLPPLMEALSGVDQLVGYNLKFDLGFLSREGLRVRRDQVLSDVLVAARLCSAEQYPDLSLRAQLNTWIDPEAGSYDLEFKQYLKKHRFKRYCDAPADMVGEYCKHDVLGTWKLWRRLEEQIQAWKLGRVWAQEQDMTRTLWWMEEWGMYYDQAYGSQKIPQLQARIRQVLLEIYALAGREFNINSGPQLGEVMADLNIVSPAVSAKTGKPSWSVGVLLSIDHPIAGKIVELRGLEKMLGTYFQSIMSWPDSVVHGQHKNWGTITGRLSCVEPNLQNIAKSTQNLGGNEVSEETLAAVSAFLGARKGESFTDMRAGTSGSNVGGVTYGGMMALSDHYVDSDQTVAVRRLFVGRPGTRLYMLDYSQMEMRVFADYVEDENLYALLENSEFDFHSYVARTVWDVDESSSLWNFYRTLAKAINFGMIYGIGIKKLASQIQKTSEEAKQYKKDYFARFPKAQQFIKRVQEVVETRGYVHNRYHRRYWVDASRSYVAVNYLVQGTSADIVKNRMNALHDYLRDEHLESRMLAQVHDEIIFELVEAEEAWLPKELQRIMEARQIQTHLPVEISRGMPSWAQKETWSEKTGEWVAK